MKKKNFERASESLSPWKGNLKSVLSDNNTVTQCGVGDFTVETNALVCGGVTVTVTQCLLIFHISCHLLANMYTASSLSLII